ncbi:MAG: hypothetical protein UU08_C0005G0025 [Candidatus Uhrbacteria bacterium GW2011_GWE2_40_58]|nr:MAG: hypothetical protein UT94_C0005G0025 [Candidatus Uhrbacteria bacterium GW2011_GWF2_40_263]KKR67975.1 MAG: hypothetical protein UU08_C0005G0025 [Candidatus Uhrbacteria bacterium GW2011_GWE2_40_58]OGL92420.1 MAG: hypothetical protein A2239_02240 [Candidatus Uhrbacteria bacterium RIFOXYA2_FULL_40_9]OGL97011.1 MAG: hypothetical protein A2332_04045 [Candidatus Uhrbacteria bacterium RIFOXYB2_FULL_41_18]HBK34750.1 hypothetical protein [Candidatus Uhrbacteria bacterium]
MSSHQVELFPTGKVVDRGPHYSGHFVPDLVGRAADLYQKGEKGGSHLKEIENAEREVHHRRFDWWQDIVWSLLGLCHWMLYGFMTICWVFLCVLTLVEGKFTFAEWFTPFLLVQAIHWLLTFIIYPLVILWCQRKLKKAEERVKTLKEMGLVRTKEECKILENPWYQFASHAAKLRDLFNEKAKAWNIMAEAIDKGVIELTDELQRYYDHLVTVRQQVERTVNTADFLVKYYEESERSGQRMSHHEIKELLAQVDEARARMDAFFEIEEMPFDPATVTARAKTILPEDVPEVDRKLLIERALASQHRATR